MNAAVEQETAQEMGRFAWLSLIGHLRKTCDVLNSGGFCSGSHRDTLRLAPQSTLHLECPSREQVNVLYRCGSGDSHWLRVHCDLDLVFLRYTVNGLVHELLGASEGDTAGFKVHGGWILLSPEELAESMLFFLIVFKS
jgi:hypothetical protein